MGGGWHVRGPASDTSAWCLCLCLYALSICSSSAFPLCARTPVRLPMDRPIHHAHSCHFCSSVDSCALSSRLLFTGGRLTLFQTDLLEMCRETQNVAGLQGALFTQFCHTRTHTHTHTLSLARMHARTHACTHTHPPTHVCTPYHFNPCKKRQACYKKYQLNNSLFFYLPAGCLCEPAAKNARVEVP